MHRAGNGRRSGGHHIRRVEDKDQQSDGCEYAFGISEDLTVSSNISKTSASVSSCFKHKKTGKSTRPQA